MSLSDLNALSAAMNAEQDVAVRALKAQLEEKQLALERAPMSAEDARAAMVSPDSDLSWREFGSLERIRLNMLGIDPAIDLLQEARHEILVALSQGRDVNTYHTALVKAMGTVHTAMVNAEFRLQSSREVFPER